MKAALIVLAAGAAIAGAAYYAFTSVSYGPLEERTGRVTRADYVPAHDEERTEKDENGREHIVTERVGPSWHVTIAWDEGLYESRTESLYSQVRVGLEVTLHVRQRLWRNKPSGWSVQAVSPR